MKHKDFPENLSWLTNLLKFPDETIRSMDGDMTVNVCYLDDSEVFYFLSKFLKNHNLPVFGTIESTSHWVGQCLSNRCSRGLVGNYDSGSDVTSVPNHTFVFGPIFSLTPKYISTGTG